MCGLFFDEKTAESSPRQEVMAFWNAGDCASIDCGISTLPTELYGLLMLAPGSGKLRTQCDRMHLENASA
jgi:hypothetical protein